MPAVLDPSPHVKDRSFNFLPSVLSFNASFSFFLFRATATHRGQILFKDALAQQLCEQGGKWRLQGRHRIPPFAHAAPAGRRAHEVTRKAHMCTYTAVPSPIPMSRYCPSYANLSEWLNHRGGCASHRWHCSTSWLPFCLMMQPESEIFGCPILPD